MSEKYVRKYISDRVKDRVIKRDGYICRYCGVDCRTKNNEWHFDHVYPVSHGGETSVGNIVIACKSCNLKKSATVGMWPKPVGYFNENKNKAGFFKGLNLIFIFEIIALMFTIYFLYSATITGDEIAKTLFTISLFVAGSFGIASAVMTKFFVNTK